MEHEQHGKRKSEEEFQPAEVDRKKQKPVAGPPPITSVYVSGLPADATVEEIATVFRKFGILMEDLATGEPKIKIYSDKDGNPKGDGLVSYLKPESVDLAVELLDDTPFNATSSQNIRVQKAEFKSKESAAKKKDLSAEEKKKLQRRKQQMEKKLDWFEAEEKGQPDRFNKIVILKQMFTQKELEEDITLIIDLKEEIRGECERLGEVTNVILYDKSDEGVVSVRFKDTISAEACVKLMHARFFAGRRITAEIFDGKTKYEKSGARSSEEEEAEEKARLERYAQYLETQEREEREGREGVGS